MGLNRKNALILVEQLWAEGYLERNFSGMAYKCPYDGTTSLRPRLLCPKCESEEMERVRLIEHLGCGHVDMERNFLQGDEYVCPKDGKKLKLIGVDYRKPGIAYYCIKCDELFPEPSLECVCTYANHTFHLDDTVQERLFTYTLNEESRSKIIRSFEYTQPLVEVFQRNGYQVKTFHQMNGSSGVSHLVDIYAEKEIEPRKTIITSILTQDNIRPEAVLKLHVTNLDINPTNVILVVIPKLDSQSRMYADRLNLSVIEGEELREVREKLEGLLIKQE